MQNDIIDKNYWLVKENGQFVKYYRNPSDFSKNINVFTEVDAESADFIFEIKTNLKGILKKNKNKPRTIFEDKLEYSQFKSKKLVYVYGGSTKPKSPNSLKNEVLNRLNVNVDIVDSLAAAKSSTAQVIFISEKNI